MIFQLSAHIDVVFIESGYCSFLFGYFPFKDNAILSPPKNAFDTVNYRPKNSIAPVRLIGFPLNKQRKIALAMARLLFGSLVTI